MQTSAYIANPYLDLFKNAMVTASNETRSCGSAKRAHSFRIVDFPAPLAWTKHIEAANAVYKNDFHGVLCMFISDMPGV